MLFVGVDAHKSTSQITVMNEAGVILSRKRVNSTREGFQKALTGYNEPMKSDPINNQKRFYARLTRR
jgi:hypothetical protein